MDIYTLKAQLADCYERIRELRTQRDQALADLAAAEADIEDLCRIRARIRAILEE